MTSREKFAIDRSASLEFDVEESLADLDLPVQGGFVSRSIVILLAHLWAKLH